MFWVGTVLFVLECRLANFDMVVLEVFLNRLRILSLF